MKKVMETEVLYDRSLGGQIHSLRQSEENMMRKLYWILTELPRVVVKELIFICFIVLSTGIFLSILGIVFVLGIFYTTDQDTQIFLMAVGGALFVLGVTAFMVSLDTGIPFVLAAYRSIPEKPLPKIRYKKLESSSGGELTLEKEAGKVTLTD